MGVNKTVLLGMGGIFIFLILLGIVCAENKVIFDEDMFIDQIAHTDVGTFDFRYYVKEGTPIIAVGGDDFRMILDEGQCKQEGIYVYCFDDVEFGKIDYEKDKEVPIISFRIEEIVPAVARTVDKSELLIGERAMVTTTITVPGRIRPRIIYIDEAPESLRIKSPSKGQVTSNTLRWEGIVDNEITITYDLELQGGDVDEEFDATVIYDLDGKDYTIKAPSISIKKKGLMDIDFDFSEDEAEVDEEIEIDLAIDKNTEEDLTVYEFEIIFPNNIDVLEYNEAFTEIGNKYELDITTLREEQEYTFKIKPASYAKTYPIIIRTDVESDDEDEEIEKEFLLESAVEELSLSLNMPSNIKFQNKFNLKANYKNKNDQTTFYNIECQIKGDLFNKDYDFKQSLPDKQTNIENQDIEFDDLSHRNVTHTFTCTYETEDGSILKSNVTKTTEININETKLEEEKKEEEEALKEREEREQELKEEMEELEEEPEDVEVEEGIEEKDEDEPGFFTKLGRALKRIFTFWRH
ncbi:hypothetical protein KY336_02055 [Candidatus Woesearchaeota archaeon]|nr:hypothetical protein [Candidatus Woesearchaeota archaeon]